MVTEHLKIQNRSISTHRIEKKLAHKYHEENVFVSTIEKITDKKFLVTGFLPKKHFTYNDQVSGLSASPFFIELSRQSNMAICHLFFNIKLEASFTMISVDWKFTGVNPFLPGSFDPIHYFVEFTRYKTRKDTTFIKISGNLYQNNDNFLNGESSFAFSDTHGDGLCLNSNVQSLSTNETPISPDIIQVRKAQNALITSPVYDPHTRSSKARMIVNTSHPYFYEHPRDHIPGMMILEAGRQAAIGALKTAFHFLQNTYGDLIEGKITFSKFASPQLDVLIEVKIQEPKRLGNAIHIPVSIVYSHNNQQIGIIEGTAAFMNKKEALLTSAYIPVT